MPYYRKTIFNHDYKFDLQLRRSHNHVDRFAEIVEDKKVEVKTETWQWEQSGNIAIEYAYNGKPSGLAKTEAEFWVHELCRDGEPLLYLMFPIERLKAVARKAYRVGHYHEGGGDGGLANNVLLRISDLLAVI